MKICDVCYMKIIRVVGETSDTEKSKFINRFIDDNIIEEDSEIRMISCTLPVRLRNTVVIDSNNNTFTLEIDGSSATVELTAATYTLGTFIKELIKVIYAYTGAYGAAVRGMEWKASLVKNVLTLEFDRVGDHVLTDATAHIQRHNGIHGGPRMVYNEDGGNWTRDLAEGGNNEGAWVYCGIPFSKGIQSEMSGNIGTSRLATDEYADWYMGLVTGALRPTKHENFAYNTNMKYGIYLSGTSVYARHEGTSYLLPIASVDGLLEAASTVLISYEPLFNDIYMTYDFYDYDGNSLVDTTSPHYDPDLDAYAFLVNGFEDGVTLYPIAGLGNHEDAELIDWTYTPSTSAIDEDGFARITTDVILGLPTVGVQDLFGILSETNTCNNNNAPGAFKGHSAVNSDHTLSSIVVSLDSYQLECFDGGQNTSVDEGRRRSVLAVIPGNYADQFQNTYVPPTADWIPLRNKNKDNLREIRWSFAYGNDYAPYLTNNSMLTIGIRPRRS